MKTSVRVLFVAAALGVGVAGALPSSAGVTPTDGQPEASSAPELVGPLVDVSPLANGPEKQQQVAPLRVADPGNHANQKAEANARADQGSSAAGDPGTSAPVLNRSWQGIDDATSAPSDSTSAIGPTRFIELVNRRYGIYNRTSNVALDTGTANFMVGSSAGNVFDPQIIWDPGTKRFYYAWDQIESSTDHRLAFGFSITASPNTGGSADWCKYSIGYGSEFPDYPKLGDTKDFILMGVNVFNGATSAFIRSDVKWLSKPPAGTTCPDPSTFLFGAKKSLKNTDGTAAFTPVPANQTDTSAKGWVVARPSSLPANYLSTYQVTKNATTGAATFGAPKKLTLPSYSVPADATQPGTSVRIDTLDTRFTQAVSAIDPARGTGTSVAVWTQHTVSGGAGAEVRWYEIDPVTTTLFQSGVNTGTGGLFVFNGAISPDRKVNGSTKLFGSNMVLGFNSSSTSQLVDFRTQSKIGSNPASASVGVAISSGAITSGCDAARGCRWGDYAAATPDPASSSTGATGKVWLTTQLTFGGTMFDWATWNAAVTP